MYSVQLGVRVKLEWMLRRSEECYVYIDTWSEAG